MIKEFELDYITRLLTLSVDIENRYKIWNNILDELCVFANDTIFKGADNPLFLYIRNVLK